MISHRIEILLSFEDDAYRALVPQLPGLCECGRSAPEAFVRIAEALAHEIRCLMELGDPLPEETMPDHVVREGESG